MVTGAVSGEVRRSNMTSYKALAGSSENLVRSEAKTGVGRGEVRGAEGGGGGDGRAEDGYIVMGGESLG